MDRTVVVIPPACRQLVVDTLLRHYEVKAEALLHTLRRRHSRQPGTIQPVLARRGQLRVLDPLLEQVARSASRPADGLRLRGPRSVLHAILADATLETAERLVDACGVLDTAEDVERSRRELVAAELLLTALAESRSPGRR